MGGVTSAFDCLNLSLNNVRWSWLREGIFLMWNDLLFGKKISRVIYFIFGENKLSKTGTSDFALMHFPIKLYGDISKL